MRSCGVHPRKHALGSVYPPGLTTMNEAALGFPGRGKIMIRFLWSNLKGYRFLVVFIFGATIFEVLASSYGIVVIKDIFNAATPPPTVKGVPPPSKEPSSPFNLVLNLYSPAPHSSSTIVTFLIIVLV